MTTPADPEGGDHKSEPATGDSAPEHIADEPAPAPPAASDADSATAPAPKPAPKPAPDAAPTPDGTPAAAADPAEAPEAPEAAEPSAAPDADVSAVPEAAPGATPAPDLAAPDLAAAAARSAPAVPEPPRRRGRRWLRVLAVCTALLVLAFAGGVWYLYRHLNANITTDSVTETELRAQEAQRPPQTPTQAENILLIGSDNRGDGNEEYGQDTGTQRSDTAILLHLSADRTNATAVSIPRDLMTHVPECVKPDGETVGPKFEQFNWAFSGGGAACTIRAVEEMTGVRVDHHLVVDFTGFKKMVNAVGGVEVCLAKPVHDQPAHLDLPAGRQKLDGEKALGFVRARHGLGDGSDTGRIGRQQDFLGSLVSKVQSNGVLLNPVKLYPLLDAATKSLTADSGLNSLDELYKLAQSLQKVPAGAIHFVTVPQEPYVADHNRDQLVQPDADRLFAAVRADQPVAVSDGSGAGSDSGANTGSGTDTGSGTGSDVRSDAGTATGPGSAHSSEPTNGSTTVPTFQGTTADRDICGKDQ